MCDYSIPASSNAFLRVFLFSSILYTTTEGLCEPVLTWGSKSKSSPTFECESVVRLCANISEGKQ